MARPQPVGASTTCEKRHVHGCGRRSFTFGKLSRDTWLYFIGYSNSFPHQHSEQSRCQVDAIRLAPFWPDRARFRTCRFHPRVPSDHPLPEKLILRASVFYPASQCQLKALVRDHTPPMYACRRSYPPPRITLKAILAGEIAANIQLCPTSFQGQQHYSKYCT